MKPFTKFKLTKDQNFKSITPKQHRKINQERSTNGTTPDISGTDNTETSKNQLNHKHCESTDDESETENKLVINMLRIKFEPELNRIFTRMNIRDTKNNQEPKTIKITKTRFIQTKITQI